MKYLIISFAFLTQVFARKMYSSILLEDINYLKFTKDEFTVSRLDKSVPTMKCTAGNCNDEQPNTIYCTQNKKEPDEWKRWECVLESKKYYLGTNTKVTCEGFDYINDPYVLQGSCNLEYHLYYKNLRFTDSELKYNFYNRFLSMFCLCFLLLYLKLK